MHELADILADTSANPLKLGRHEKHSIEVVVDRLRARPGLRERLTDSVETALKVGEGTLIIAVDNGARDTTDRVYSNRYACPIHPARALPELEPRLFSFNAPEGACPVCHGLGTLYEFDEDLVLPDKDASLAKAIAPWSSGPAVGFSGRYLRRFYRDTGLTAGTKLSFAV